MVSNAPTQLTSATCFVLDSNHSRDTDRFAPGAAARPQGNKKHPYTTDTTDTPFTTHKIIGSSKETKTWRQLSDEYVSEQTAQQYFRRPLYSMQNTVGRRGLRSTPVGCCQEDIGKEASAALLPMYHCGTNPCVAANARQCMKGCTRCSRKRSLTQEAVPCARLADRK